MVYLRGYVTADRPSLFGGMEARLYGESEFVTSVSSFVPAKHPNTTQGFEIFAIASEAPDMSRLRLRFDITVNGRKETLDYDYAKINATTLRAKFSVIQTWNDQLAGGRVKTIIDIGGRARSGKTLKAAYPGIEVTVADITPAPDVDIIADVHELSRHVHEPFDAFMAIATFEHLIMPWKAAIEINKALKVGAPGYVVTHQTVGMHEVPWDFFRYSDKAWKGIFNVHTGFEIVDAGMTLPTMIIPHVWQKQHNDAEQAVGYMMSAVVVRKISAPKVKWDVPVSDVTSDMYPH